MKFHIYSVLVGKFRKVPAICRNNAGSVAHSVALVATSYDGNAMISKKLHCRCEKNIARVSVALMSPDMIIIPSH